MKLALVVCIAVVIATQGYAAVAPPLQSAGQNIARSFTDANRTAVDEVISSAKSAANSLESKGSDLASDLSDNIQDVLTEYDVNTTSYNSVATSVANLSSDAQLDLLGDLIKAPLDAISTIFASSRKLLHSSD